MRVLLFVLLTVMAVSASVSAAEPAKVSVSASDQLVSEVAAQIAKDAGVSIVVDPKADAAVSVSLSEAELPQILDSLCKVTKLTWKKVQFAKRAEDKVTLEQIKSSILALASMPVVAVSVQDSSAKGGAVFAREQPATAEVTSFKLPESYSWATVYVIYNPNQPAASETASNSDNSPDKSIDPNKRFQSLANMTADDRKKAFANEFVDMMTLTPEARRQVIQDQFSAVQELDPKMRDQFLRDMGSAMRGMMTNRSNNRGSSSRNSNSSRNIVIPAK